MSPFSYLAVIENDLKYVREIVSEYLQKDTHPKIQEICHYLVASPGKQLRPALCLLSFRAISDSPVPEKVYQLAAALELIHMASLVHDDVIDNAPLRHEVPTIYAKWGTEVAIPIGVYLYTIALGFIVKIGDIALLDKFSLCVKHLCEGELSQVFERGDITMSLDYYLDMIHKKTAILFQVACEMGAVFAGARPEQIAALSEYGRTLGLSFQIVDDYLDIAGKQSDLNKKTTQDIEMGELTLPFIYFLHQATESERHLIHSLFQQPTSDKITQAQTLLRTSNAMTQTKELAISYLNQAQEKLTQIPDSDAKKQLSDIAAFVQKRGFGI